MYIHDYFDSLQHGIWKNRKIGFLERPVLCKAFDDHHGLFKGSVFFWDGSRLTMKEVSAQRKAFQRFSATPTPIPKATSTSSVMTTPRTILIYPHSLSTNITVLQKRLGPQRSPHWPKSSLKSKPF